MSIKTNHSTESLKPASDVLTIEAKGALAIPVGEQSERPQSPLAGHVRFDQTAIEPEYYDGSVWNIFANKNYVDLADQELQAQINYITNNIDPAAIDSLAEIVQDYQTANLNFGQLLIDEVNAREQADTLLQSTVDNLSLDSLTDTTINGPTDGQVLSFDIVTGQFKNQTHQFSVGTKQYVANGVSATFNLQETVSSTNNLVVSVNGIVQQPNYSYTIVNGNILTFDELPESGDSIEVRILKSTVTNDRPRPTVTAVSYSTVGQYTTISVTATDITFGTGARIGDTPITRIDYPTPNIMQLMIETSLMGSAEWQTPRNLTLVDTSGNEFVFTNLINYGVSKPYWTKSNSYIGTFSGGDTINFTLGVNNAVSITIDPAYAGESAIGWLSISGNSIVGTAPQNSSPTRYELSVTASNGSVYITKNFWLLVI
jgi:hypothetical protein